MDQVCPCRGYKTWQSRSPFACRTTRLQRTTCRCGGRLACPQPPRRATAWPQLVIYAPHDTPHRVSDRGFCNLHAVWCSWAKRHRAGRGLRGEVLEGIHGLKKRCLPCAKRLNEQVVKWYLPALCAALYASWPSRTRSTSFRRSSLRK